MAHSDMIITLDEASDFVAVIFDDPEDERDDHPGLHETCMQKEHFYRYYDIEDYDEVVASVFFEPKFDQYWIVFTDGHVEAFDHPNDHPVLKAMDKMSSKLKDDEFVIKYQLFPGISFRGDGGWMECLKELGVKDMVSIGDKYFDKVLQAEEKLKEDKDKDPKYEIVERYGLELWYKGV